MNKKAHVPDGEAPENEEQSEVQEPDENDLTEPAEEPGAEEGEAPVEGAAPQGEEPEEDAEEDGGEAEEGGPDIFTAIQKELSDSREKCASLEEKCSSLEEKAASLQNSYLRLQADWDNYRKRTEASRAEERVRASEGLVKDLLPVLDSLELALKHAKESGEGGSLTEGVEAIRGKMLQVLGKHNVEQLEAQGQPFDAMQHQAVNTREDDSVPEETVVEVYQQGYKMGEKVLRPAMVVTSTGGPAQGADESSEEE